MSWARIDDKSAFHAKVIAVGNAGWGAFCRMLAHACAHLTDGFVDGRTARLIASRSEIERLVSAGLLDRVEGGFSIHDFLDWNPSADEARERRAGVSAVRSAAGKAGGKRSGEVRRTKQPGPSNEANVKQVASALVEANAKQNEAPSRTHPVPIQKREDPPQAPLGPEVANAPEPAAKSKRGTRLAADWSPSADVLAAFAAEGIDAARAVPEFRDHWAAVAGRHGVKLDWNATFRNRIRQLIDQGRAPRMAGSAARVVGDRAPNGKPWLQRPATDLPPSGPRVMPAATWPDEDEEPPPSFGTGPCGDFQDVPATTPATGTQRALFGAPRRIA